MDDELVHLAAFQDVLSPLGIELDEKTYWDEYLGLDDAGAFRHAFEQKGESISDARVTELIEAKKPCYMRRAEKTLTPFPGAAEVLRAQAELGPVLIVSGALEAEIELGLSVLGVRDLVAKVISAEHTTRSKPDPEGYQLGIEHLEKLGIEHPLQQTIVFEDSIDGIQAAKAAKLTCVGIAHSYPLDRLNGAGADASVERIADVDQSLLRRVFESRA